MSSEPREKRILSGVKPSGTLHLGNYFGALRQHIALQEHNRCVYFIADYHSMTTLQDPQVRREYAREIALDYLALGLDPERTILYRQSDLPETAELYWMLATVTPKGLLERGHAYKDAVAKGEQVFAGLFDYPILQAADILMHRADLVPVGQDQKQHIEFTRDIAIKFNAAYGEVLDIPDAYILEDVAVVPGSDGQKMSKSYGNTIEMFAPEKTLRKQIMGIVTDSTPVEEPKDPDTSSLYQLWCLFATAEERAEMADRFRKGGLGYGEVKKDLFARVLEHFADARLRRDDLVAHPDRVEDILADAAQRARQTADPLIEACRQAAGLGPPRRG
jgi:tryptophanyl-tRNA synthetase